MTKMKIIPAIIAIFFGAGFLWIEMGFNYFPPIPTISLTSVLEAPEHAKARSAVIATLRNPDSAAIDDMRTVKFEQARYVCGVVNAKNRTGQYAGARDFVYEVSGDVVIIDSDYEIASVHHAYRACPEETLGKPMVISLDKLNKIAAALPQSNIQIAMPIGNKPAANSEGSQDLRAGIEGLKRNAEQRISVSPGSGAITSRTASSSSPVSGREWREEQPPERWPHFSPNDPLSNEADSNLGDSEALALAAEVERKWASPNRPSGIEILRAQRGLLVIKETSPQFSIAWASFVRLQNMRREANT